MYYPLDQNFSVDELMMLFYVERGEQLSMEFSDLLVEILSLFLERRAGFFMGPGA